MSCTEVRNRLAPGSLASLTRSRATIWSAVSLRSDSGFRVTNICPVLRWEPPVKPVTLTTAGSDWTILMKLSSLVRISWNDVAWSARMKPIRRPVSCCGKKPLGTITYRYTFSATVSSSTIQTIGPWRSATPSVRA